jgi:thioesterase domain-containing protein/acyl carrier protein
VVRQALAQGGVAPSEVDFVECHGTGTALGDPIEVQALATVYGQGRAADRPLALGTAKANIGHMEPAAGMGGVLKVLLALDREQVPGQPPLGALNPLLPWEALPVKVLREAMPWPRGARPRRAGVSAFGMSGTNAHVVLEEAPAATNAPPVVERSVALLVLSARSAAAVNAQAARLRNHLERHPDLALGDVAFTLATTRSPMEYRIAIPVSSRETLLGALADAAEGRTPPGATRGAPASSGGKGGKVAFVFGGQGAPVAEMGRELCGLWPAFREAFDRCIARFDAELDRPLREVMWANPVSPEADWLTQPAYSQAAVFTLEHALCALWRSWGVEPELVGSPSPLGSGCVQVLSPSPSGKGSVARDDDGVKALHRTDATVVVEVGLSPTCPGQMPEVPPDGTPTVLPGPRAGRAEALDTLSALGAYWALGGSVTWAGVFPEAGRRLVLPAYAWQRQRFWTEAPARAAPKTRANGHADADGARGAWQRLRAVPEGLHFRRSRVGRIEDALRMHPGVREVAVVERNAGFRSFVAYLVASGTQAPHAAELRAFLQGRLPDQLLPATFVPLASLPRDQGGKIDYAALPALEVGTLSVFRVRGASPEEVKPRLKAIFEEVLGVKGVGDDDSFFALGGDSLFALDIFRRIETDFAKKLPINTILRAPTAAKLADILLTDNWRPQWSSLVPMQPLGSKPPFFCVHGGGGLVVFYYPLAARLGNDQPFYGLEPRGASGYHPHDKTIEAMAAHYLSEVRQVQPRGPYYLGGASYGGILAFEMAQQLRSSGEEVALVAMFDTWAPGYHDPVHKVPKLVGAMAEAYRRAEQHVGSLMMLEPEKRLVYLESKLRRAADEARDTVFDWSVQARKTYFNTMGKPLPVAVEEAQNEMDKALKAYQPRPYPGKVTLFRATRQPYGLTSDRTLGWGPHVTGELEIIDMPGYHASMISEPRVRLLAEKLRRHLGA